MNIKLGIALLYNLISAVISAITYKVFSYSACILVAYFSIVLSLLEIPMLKNEMEKDDGEL